MEALKKVNGWLMHKDMLVALIENGRITDLLAEKHLPIYLKNYTDLESWLKTREVDPHRTNSRLLKKYLRLAQGAETDGVLHVNALALTDSFWIKQKDSTLTWENVQFKYNELADIALQGHFHTERLNTHSPDFTNIGSYEKCWRIENGSWYMYKKGTAREIFSELLAYETGKLLGFNMAEYTFESDSLIRSTNFVDVEKYDYEPANSWMLDNDDYVENYRYLQNISQDLANQYFEILMMDTICYNVDRHTFNYGVMRDSVSGDIIEMAPNFDNNLSALSVLPDEKVRGRKIGLFESAFEDFCQETNAVQNYAKQLPEMNWEKLKIILSDLLKKFDSITLEIDDILSFIKVGYDFVQQQFNKN